MPEALDKNIKHLRDVGGGTAGRNDSATPKTASRLHMGLECVGPDYRPAMPELVGRVGA